MDTVTQDSTAPPPAAAAAAVANDDQEDYDVDVIIIQSSGHYRLCNDIHIRSSQSFASINATVEPQ